MYCPSAFPVQRPLQNYMAGRLTDYRLVYTALVNRLHEQSCIIHTGYSFAVKWEIIVHCDVKTRRRRSHYRRSDWMAQLKCRSVWPPPLSALEWCSLTIQLGRFADSAHPQGCLVHNFLFFFCTPIRAHMLSVGDRQTDRQTYQCSVHVPPGSTPIAVNIAHTLDAHIPC